MLIYILYICPKCPRTLHLLVQGLGLSQTVPSKDMSRPNTNTAQKGIARSPHHFTIDIFITKCPMSSGKIRVIIYLFYLFIFFYLIQYIIHIIYFFLGRPAVAHRRNNIDRRRNSYRNRRRSRSRSSNRRSRRSHRSHSRSRSNRRSHRFRSRSRSNRRSRRSRSRYRRSRRSRSRS